MNVALYNSDEERVSKCRCINSDAEDSDDCNDDVKLVGSSNEKAQRRSKRLSSAPPI